MTDIGVQHILEAVRLYGPDIEKYRDLGMIRVAQYDDLLLFNYTQQCQWARRWNDAEQAARGLIVDYPTATIVARPFGKFFNLDERPETKLESLPTGPCEVTAKMDGSLGILYWHGENPRIATRGSFTSEQALWATQHLSRYNITPDVIGTTLLFEIIYPDNRIVLNYGDREDLVLIGARSYDGTDYDHSALEVLAERCGFHVVPQVECNSINDLIPLMQTSEGIEGWVVRYPDGFRVKVKTADYMRLHKIISNCTPKAVHEAMLVGTLDDFVVGLPEEYRIEVDAMVYDLRAFMANETTRLNDIYDKLRHHATESRKAYASQVMQHHRNDFAFLFALLDGWDIQPLILKYMDAEAICDSYT